MQNATLWSLQHKGKEIEITDEVGQKEICTVGGKEATEQDKVCAEPQSPSVARYSVVVLSQPAHPQQVPALGSESHSAS